MQKPIIEVTLDEKKQPAYAQATMTIAAPPAKVWQLVSAVEQYPGTVPMLHKVKRTGDRVNVHLRFKISLFSVGFDFTADAKYEEPRWLELRGVGGEPRDIHIRFELEDLGGGETRVRAGISFDVFSLGWLTKYFLKHHPEIQFGIFPGCALALVDSMRRAAEGA